MIVFFFGDSIIQGFWDSDGGWPGRVRKSFDAMYLAGKSDNYSSFFNLGVDGDDTRNIAKRFDNEVAARFSGKDEIVFVFATGTNDTIFRQENNSSEPFEYVERLADLHGKAKKYSDRILFVGLTPVQDELLNPMPWSETGKCYSTERMRLFDETLRSFCSQRGAVYINVWNKFDEHDLNDLMHDGVHPNSMGHEIIYNEVKKALSKIL